MMDEGVPSDLKRVRPDLDGVPETTLWTLYHRAREAGRSRSPLHDPKAIEVMRNIDFDFKGRFGSGPPAFGRFIGFRAMAFDRVVGSVLRTDPDATVVALGEGLETQFWRMDNDRVRWFTVELPETAALRETLLPSDPPRRRLFAGSATDPVWIDELAARPGDRVVVIAQGLLMYLAPTQVRDLIIRCSAAFPGGLLAFDTVPPFFSRLTLAGKMRGPGGYAAPPMPWGVDTRTLMRRLREQPGIASAQLVEPPGLPTPVRLGARLGQKAGPVTRLLPGVVRLDFAR